eukprot:TRINITY_DN78562_c0_g1_i1.p1 TRINITY_DN78562_c0_g1~~TRINITY_DN78562_c0_g1_i1.p1  ORF type:complete len:267 (-),score=55.18 TRINITY_DN78562_c0_g1_i1:93-893(-)
MASSHRLAFAAVLVILSKPFVSFARRVEGQEVDAGEVQHSAGALEVSIGPIASGMTEAFRKLEGVPADQIKLKELQEVVLTTASSLSESFEAAATQIRNNILMLSSCPMFDGEGTVGSCLQSEEAKCTEECKKHRPACCVQDKSKKKPAVLAEGSPPMGILWSMRMLWFIADMFERVSNGETMSHAGDRLQVTFAKCTMCPDFVVNKLVKSSLAAGFKDSGKYIEKFGGEEEALKDMKSFAEVALPIITGIFDQLVKHNLDGTKGY